MDAHLHDGHFHTMPHHEPTHLHTSGFEEAHGPHVGHFHAMPHHEPTHLHVSGSEESHGHHHQHVIHKTDSAFGEHATPHSDSTQTVLHPNHTSIFANHDHSSIMHKASVASVFGPSPPAHESHGSIFASGGTKSGIDISGCIGKSPQICGEYHNHNDSTWSVGVKHDVGHGVTIGVGVGHGQTPTVTGSIGVRFK